MFLDIITINDIVIYIIYSIIITNLIIGAIILFSISIAEFNLLSLIKFMFTNGIKRLASGTGKVILYGSGLATGADAALNLHQKYKDHQKGSNPNPNATTSPKPTNPTPKPANPTPKPAKTPTKAPSSTPAKSSLLLWALSYLDINVTENSSDMFNFLSSILTLELIVLLGFINLLFYFISYILILKYDIESKFSSPRIKKIIRFYVKTSIYFIIFEIILTLISILSIITLVFIVVKSLI